MTGLAQVQRLARRIDVATPPQRDRAVDALRALAIAGVIGGHWLVTGLVAGGSPGHTTVSDSSPLASMPWLAPVSWVFQTLAVFFLVGGYASARSYRGGYLPWLRRRLVRLARPVAALVAVWIPVTTGLLLAGVPGTTIHTLLFLVISPFITVSSLGLLAGRPAGLLTAPVSGTWVAERLAWLPVFALVLAGLWAAFRRAERGLAGANRQPGRGLDLGQPQVGDQPLAAAGGQAGQHVLQFVHVAGHHGEQVVHLAGHGVRGDDLRQGPDQVVEHVARAHVMTGQGGRHVDLQREAAGVRVELGTDDADHARLLEPADPVQGSGRRQADQPGQLHVGPVRILLQRSQQLDVNIVK
jgi:hypothetical protein